MHTEHVGKILDAKDEGRARGYSAEEKATDFGSALGNGAEPIDDRAQHAIGNVEANLDRNRLARGLPAPVTGGGGMMRELRVFCCQTFHYLIK